MTKLSEAKKWNQPYDEPDPAALSAYQREIYSSFTRPIFSTKPQQWEELARQKVPAENFGYVYGSAGSFQTYDANRAAFDRYRLRPHMLVNATRRDTSVELFGHTYPSPLLVAPVGVQNIMHSDAEEATARACLNTRVPMILSTAATRTIEQVAQANGAGERWFQLYWPKPQEEAITVSLLDRARANGYKVLVVTLDTFALAWRPEDLDHSYLPFLYGDGCQIGHSDPVFQERYEEMLANDKRSATEKMAEMWHLVQRPGNPFGAMRLLANASKLKKSRAWMDIMNSGTYREWKHLETLKKLWNGPIVLKGIQTVADAHRAIHHGMDGIIVSNHGGRQLDGAIASLDALAAIGADEQVMQSGLTLLFDSGIRTGSDVLKALALGAKAVLIGRPFMYGLAIKGQAGVEHVLRCIQADTDNMLGNLGKKSVRDLTRDDLQIRREVKL
jgi:isopentenyl diphosphate isomerase/L-lactate dehydrogenase-like FMN-dependent dehydrogenase